MLIIQIHNYQPPKNSIFNVFYIEIIISQLTYFSFCKEVKKIRLLHQTSYKMDQRVNDRAVV